MSFFQNEEKFLTHKFPEGNGEFFESKVYFQCIYEFIRNMNIHAILKKQSLFLHFLTLRTTALVPLFNICFKKDLIG
jgi:hypothetical protein